MTLAYPLHWPQGWPRTPGHRQQRSAYKATFVKTRDLLIKELKNFSAKDVVVSSNIPVRQDGLPYANMSEPKETAIAVYWTDRNTGEPRVMACDAWRTTRENLRAVYLCIQALRTMERTKAGEIMKRAYAGFKQLPAAGEMTVTVADWRVVFGFTDEQVVTVQDIHDAYKTLVKACHPDLGGSQEAFMRLNRAKAMALNDQEGL